MSITTFLLMVSACGAALAPNQYIFLAWSCLTGACIGANFSTVVVYSTEFSPIKYRTVGPLLALLGSYTSMFSVNVIGYFVLNSLGWRWLILIITLPVIPAFILLLSLPESPRYLCVSGQGEEALGAVRTMAKLNRVPLPENLQVYCHQGQELGSFTLLFRSPEHRSATILLALMYFANIFIETGILVFLPLAFSTQYCGSGGKPPTRKRCDPLDQADLWKLSVSAIGSLVGCVLAYILAVVFGRLKPLRTTGVVQIVVLTTLFVCVNNMYLFGIATGIKIVNAITCMLIWLIVPESFPTFIRNTATGTINSSGKMGAVLGTAMVYLLFYRSTIAVILCFLAIAVLSCVCSFIFDRETKEVQLTET